MAEEEAKNRGANAGRRSEAITELARTWYDLVEFYKQFESQQEKTDRYTTLPDHLKNTGVQLQYDENAALPSGRAEKVAGMQMREEAIGGVAERREAGREEKGSANKDHVFPRRPPPPPAVQQSGSEALHQTFVQTEDMRTKQEVLMKKTEQLSMYLVDATAKRRQQQWRRQRRARRQQRRRRRRRRRRSRRFLGSSTAKPQWSRVTSVACAVAAVAAGARARRPRGRRRTPHPTADPPANLLGEALAGMLIRPTVRDV